MFEITKSVISFVEGDHMSVRIFWIYDRCYDTVNNFFFFFSDDINIFSCKLQERQTIFYTFILLPLGQKVTSH